MPPDPLPEPTHDHGATAWGPGACELCWNPEYHADHEAWERRQREQLVQVLAEGLTRVHHSERVSIASAALDALTAAGYQIVPKVELEGLEAEWGSYQDALRTIATTTSKWTDCAAIALAALSDPEVTDE